MNPTVLSSLTFALGGLLAVGGLVLTILPGSVLAGLALAVLGGGMLVFAPMLAKVA